METNKKFWHTIEVLDISNNALQQRNCKENLEPLSRFIS
jgi:hypothetical protein